MNECRDFRLFVLLYQLNHCISFAAIISRLPLRLSMIAFGHSQRSLSYPPIAMGKQSLAK
jgi:hypothetical protein